MRRSDFYKSLRRISGKFKWKVDNGCLRGIPKFNNNLHVSNFCPLETRSLVKYKNNSWNNNGEISSTDVDIIIKAADTPLKDIKIPIVRRVRKALFNAVGLKRGL